MGTLTVKHAGTWKQPQKLFVKHAAAWKEPTGAWVRKDGTWHRVWPGIDPALTLDLDFTATTTLDPRITFSRASTGTYYDSAGVLRTAATNAPRFDHDPITHAPKGLLIEEQRANWATTSQDFSHSGWVKTGATVTADQTTAPDGTTSADLVTATATAAFVDQNQVISTGVLFGGVYVKKGTSDWIYLSVVQAGVDEPKAYFNLNTGAVGTVESPLTNVSIQDVGNGWYRCAVCRAAVAGTERFKIALCDADKATAVTVGRTVYVWGAQCENQTAASGLSSYIPVPSTSSVTRAADVAVMTGTNFSSWYNQSAGTFVAEFDLLALSTSNQSIMSADAGSNSQSIHFLKNASGDPRTDVTASTIQFSSVVPGTISAGTTHKLGLSFALNDFAACLSGGTVALDTVGTLPTPTQLRIGASPTGISPPNGHLRRIRFFNAAKSDADLKALTT